MIVRYSESREFWAAWALSLAGEDAIEQRYVSAAAMILDFCGRQQ